MSRPGSQERGFLLPESPESSCSECRWDPRLESCSHRLALHVSSSWVERVMERKLRHHEVPG